MHLSFLIDPLEALNPKKDSSLDLMVEARRRGHQVSILEYRDVSLWSGTPFAELTPVEAQRDPVTSTPVVRRTGTPRRTPVADCDAMFIRKDPPFDSQYLAVTYMLDRHDLPTRFVNSPRGVREVNEKLFATRYPESTPQTLIAWSLEEAHRFARQFPQVVLKSIFLGSGNSVFLASAGDASFAERFHTILRLESPGPVIVQEYLPQVAGGDTRVMLLNGVPLAALGRRPAQGDFRANIAQGGEAFAVELKDEQRKAATKIGADLVTRGIMFAGLDFIGDRLIEINVTSPTLIQELRRVSGFDVSARLLDIVESKA